MESLYLLIPIALVFLVIAIRFLFWAINSGQYDDLDTEGQRILFDEEPAKKTDNKPQATTEKTDSPQNPSDPTPSAQSQQDS